MLHPGIYQFGPAKKKARFFSRACSSDGHDSFFGRPRFPFFCIGLNTDGILSKDGGGGVGAVDLTASLIVSRDKQKSICALKVLSSGGCGRLQIGHVHCSSATGSDRGVIVAP